MTLIEQNFTLKYEVVKFHALKPGASGDFNGKPYSSSMKFRATNVVEKVNDSVGVQEIETIIEFKIPCSTNEEAKQVSELVRKSRANNVPIYVNGDIPRKQEQGDIYNVVSFDNGDDFIALNGSPKKSDK